MPVLKFHDFINESFTTTSEGSNELGAYFIKLLAIRDQSHIFHWQTRSIAEHDAFGDFYTQFIIDFDALVEMIMGLNGRPVFGKSSIQMLDYSEENINQLLELARTVLESDLEEIVNPSENEEIFDQARIITANINKLKYLLTLK
jgi:hypothetical protein